MRAQEDIIKVARHRVAVFHQDASSRATGLKLAYYAARHEFTRRRAQDHGPASRALPDLVQRGWLRISHGVAYHR